MCKWNRPSCICRIIYFLRWLIIFNKCNTTGAISGTGTANSSSASEFFHGFSVVRIAQSCVFCVRYYTQEKTEGAIKNGQSRDTGNIGYTCHNEKTNRTKNTTQHRKLKKNEQPGTHQMFFNHCLSYCPFSCGHCIVCSSNYVFWVPLGIVSNQRLILFTQCMCDNGQLYQHRHELITFLKHVDKFRHTVLQPIKSHI